MKKYLLFLGALLLMIQACKKAEDVTSKEDLLRGGAWHRGAGKAVFYKNGSHDTTDYWANMPNCVKDDNLTFNTNYNGVLNNGADKCNPGDGDSVPFHWEITKNGTVLSIYNADEYFPTGNSVNATILSLTINSMSLRYSYIHKDSLSLVTDTTIYTDLYVKY